MWDFKYFPQVNCAGIDCYLSGLHDCPRGQSFFLDLFNKLN